VETNDVPKQQTITMSAPSATIQVKWDLSMERIMKVTEEQFRYEWFSGTGKGGQHRNKHQNCCRCIHEPTGIQANGTNSRSREDNKRAAYITCLSRVQAHFHKDKERFLAGNERIRTYHEPDNRVVDHASGYQDTWTNVIIKGNVEDVIDARAKVMR
jgi:peptide chain release factor 1